jgi:hypothetical protein
MDRPELSMFQTDISLWPLREWAWIIVPALVGGSLTWYKKLQKPGKVFKFSELIGELSIAGFTGFIVALPLIYFDVDTKLIVVASTIAGHFAARSILLLEFVLEVKAAKLADIDRAEFEKQILKEGFENDDKMMNFGDALTQCMGGSIISRIVWNSEIWVSMTGRESGIEVKADKFWSLSNAQYAESQPSKSATVLPYLTKKTADGNIEVGWSPTQADLLSRDWKVITLDKAAPKADT